MPDSQSSDSGSLGLSSVLTGPLVVKGYHFTSTTTPSLAYGENCDIVKGYRITNKSAVVAKASTDSLRFEREFYIMKKLYQYKGGSSFIVRQLEYINMPSGITVVIYADEGTGYLQQQNHHTDDTMTGLKSSRNNVNGSDEASSSSTTIYSEDNTSNASAVGGIAQSSVEQQQPSKSKRKKSITRYDPLDENSPMPIYDLCTFLRFAIKCFQALEFIHKHNNWHHEINLNALQWDGTDEGPVKLWNFGSGSKSLESYLSSEGWRKTAKNKRLMNMLQSLLVYMSPEQTGRTTYTPDHRSDIYSLGIVFFTILTSRAPFEGRPLEILNGILSKKIPLAHELRADLPEVVSRIIEKMTNKAPDDRYTSAHGARSDFEECLKRLMTTGESPSTSQESISSFTLAQHDVASVFTLPKSIYGRQNSISEITFIIERCSGIYKPMRLRSSSNSNNDKNRSRVSNSAFGITDSTMHEILSDEASDRVTLNSDVAHRSTTSPSRCSAGIEGSEISSISGRLAASNSRKESATFVGVYGPGGIGKSTLFTAVKATARKNGYVATCKFDSRNKIPYSAVLRSLSQILQQILSESEIDAFYEHVKLSLGTQFSNISMITDFVPELKPMLYSEDSENNDILSMQMDNVEARIRFHNLYVELIRAITRWGMTTLFLDDLHQADDPSLEILEALAASRVKILIFMSYRDQEVTPKLADLLKNQIADIHLIGVNPINNEALTDFICDALHRSRDTANKEAVLPLVDIIYKKTKGNVFYISQLLRTLERKRFIYFDWETNEWSYDLKEIENAAIFEHGDFRGSDAELDVSFIVARLRELPPASQTLLKLVSFVGDTFSWSTVKDLMINNAENRQEGSTSTTDLDDASTVSDMNGSCGSSSGGGVSGSEISAARSASYQSLNLTSVGTSNAGGRCFYHNDTSSKSSHYSGSNDPISGLQTVIQEGYILPVSMDEFRWVHDRVAQAAAELANPDSHNKIHLSIAQHMMKETDVDAFLAADHLLKCQDLVMSLEDRQPYRNILILAGDRGKSTGALSMSFAYYMLAIRLAHPEQEWTDQEYTKSLQLYCNAANLSWTVGEYETTEKFIQIIFDNAKEPLDRLPAYDVQARYYLATQMHNKARLALLQALDELGDEVSEMDVSEKGLQSIFDQTQTLVEKHGHDAILELPPCKDILLKAMMSVMDELIAVCYFSGQKGEMLYWSCRLVILCIIHGPTHVSGTGFITSGLAFAVASKNYPFAVKIGTIGIALADKYGNNQDRGRSHCIYASFVRQWGFSLQENLSKHIRPGVQFSLSAGDRIYSTANQAHVAITMFYCGHHVADTLRECEQIYEEIYTWSPTTDMNSFVMTIIRACKALQGQTYVDTPNVYDGDDGFNDEHFLNESYKHGSNPEVAQNWYESYKMVPLTIYGHYDAAIETGKRCAKTMGAHPNHRHTYLNLAYLSLALIQKARSDPENRQFYMNELKKHEDYLHEWAVHSRINYAMYWTFIQAELISLEDTHEAYFRAAQLYEEAITQAREGSWYLELCIIHEYAGAFYNRIGFSNVAYGFIKKAIEMYVAHGSYGKVRHINSLFSDLLSDLSDDRLERHEKGIQTDPIPFHGQPAWSTSSSSHDNANNNAATNEPYAEEYIPPVTTEESLMTLDILDMASILKSSQVISSEVRFDNLLGSMMNIIFENSGADCVAIVVKDEKFGLCAHGKEGTTHSYDPPLPLSEKDKLISSRIVHHTINTGESIFIKNVEEDPRFAVGPWFEETGRKSVICMPIIHKCTTVGCLLIEGTVGVFTQRHITVLSLLCQQMGISITNAFLFKSVQRVTMANMKMIEMQKQALEEARRSKEAADKATRLREIFLANMSHEIRTPFAGFYGMISLLADTKLDAEQRDLVRTAKESCEMLLQLIDDLLNFSKLQANKVTLDLSPVIIEDLVADVIEMLVAMAIQKCINITYTIADDVPAVVIADGNRLRQIIINLLGNAIKFTHEGEIIIRCSVAESREKSLTETAVGGSNRVPLLFEVVDSGIGISKEQRKALFVPFSQVDGSTTRKYGGTGLGLSICLQLVKLMSGRIDVDSEPSKGSRFFFTIAAGRTDQGLKRIEFVQDHLNTLKDTKVLVADKYASTMAMIRQLLPGITVDEVCPTNDALLQQPLYADRHQDASSSTTSASSVNDLNHYPVIIVGLFLTHDPEFEAWAKKLKKYLKHAKCIVVMHYPRGALSDMLMGNIANNKGLLTPSAAHFDANDYWGEEHSKNKQQQSPFRPFNNNEPVATIIQAAGLDFEHTKQHQTVVRMPVPIRRKKLLKLMMGIREHEQQKQFSKSVALKPAYLSFLPPPASDEGATPTSSTQQQQSSVKRKPISKRPTISARVSSEGQRLVDSLTPEELELFKTQNILIAEDNMVARKLLFKQLKRLEFNVVCAVNGQEAIDQYIECGPGYFKMAFFDHHMPKCDGVEAIKRIREMEKEKNLARLSIVTLTADIQDSARELCMNAGFDDYLTKPMSHTTFATALRRFCCDILYQKEE
ncbi:hypothetical protein BDA99DRAFT_604282 [Phascolomyces articulosus]|uniref:histidine kinase n=1 Tax=Phascolomyces articulosus TaxID=60185 RepID=A0AAD5K1M6_9FUNG|nr:hypothetical protein BDA99DRAFT_604282 [Phascolomyces articulosus]